MHVIGKIGYHAAASGTVTLAHGERMIGLWCLATGAGAYVTVDGGDQIPLVANVPFSFALESRTEEWVGPIDIVFHATAAYFVKTKKKVGG